MAEQVSVTSDSRAAHPRHGPLSLVTRGLVVGCLVLCATMLSEPAGAQTAVSYSLDFFRPQTLISPTIPAGYDRGGNVSIDEMSRPGFDTLPVDVGSFRLYPEVATYIGGSSNVLLTKSNPKPDLLIGARISLTASADWGTSNLVIIAKDFENIWAHNAVRSQDQGNINASYQIDASDTLEFAVEGAFRRYGDNNAIGTVNELGDVLLITQQKFAAARAQYESGSIRQIISVDVTHFNLDPVYSALTGLEQNYYFDHTVYRVTSQTEYAFTPRVAALGQINVYKTNYSSALPDGLPNYDSLSYKILAGLSMDVPGLLRGQISAGFGHRDYRSSIYHTPSGLAVASRLELFPRDQDNITLVVVKDFDDGSLYSLGPIKFTTETFIYEHEVKTNVIAGFQLNGLQILPISQFTSRTLPPTSDYGGSLYAKILADHHFSIMFEAGVEKNVNNTSSATIADYAPNTEFRAQITFSYRL